MGHMQSADPDQMPQNLESDKGLHCLLTKCSIINLNKNEKKKNTQQLLKHIWTGPIDKSGKFNFGLIGLNIIFLVCKFLLGGFKDR